MSLKIHLSKAGRHGQRQYRIIVSEKNGKSIDAIGTYNPQAKGAELSLNQKLYSEWIGKGALPSPTVKKIVEKK